jgi:phytoene dehydrogenase-like protein
MQDNKVKTNEMKYDVIIIGGGLSGLTAGAFLSRKGKKVILLEQHSAVGGLASGFTRKGYYFDAAIGRNMMELFQGIWEELGITRKIVFEAHQASFLVNDYHFSYTNLRSAFDELAKLFPEEKEGLTNLYQDHIQKIEVFLNTNLRMGNPSTYSGPKKIGQWLHFCSKLPHIGIPNFIFGIKAFTLKAEDILKKYLDENGAASAFLTSIKGFHGAPIFYIPAALISFISNSYPSNGFQGLCDELAKIITFNKGVVITSAPVKRIIIEDHAAIGVEYRHKGQKENVFTKKIISAIDLKKSFFRLIGENHLENEFCETLKKEKMSESILIIYLGLNIRTDKIKEYLYSHPELIYIPDLTVIHRDPMRWDSYNPIPIFTIHSSSIHNPLHAPKNKTNLRVYLPAVAPEGWMNNWGITDGEKTDTYKEIKEKIITQVLKSLEKIIPEINDRSLIEVCELATPYTTERYTGNTGGSSVGFTKDISEKHIYGSRFGEFYNQYKKIKNLYFIGHQTGIGGMTGALLSAKKIIGKI